MTVLYSMVSAHLLVAQTARDIAQRSFSSVLLIATSDAGRQPLALGSGFFVRPGVIATNLHVVRGSAAATAKVVGSSTAFSVGGIVAMDSIHDLALLSLNGAAGSPLAIGDSRAMSIGDEVYAVGNPQGLEGTFSQGIISGIRLLGADTLLQIAAPISPGSSGGPVLNAHGEVIGVAVASFREGQNLNFAVPAVYLTALLGRAGSLQPLTAAPRLRASRGVAGSANNAGVQGTLFRWDPYPYGSCLMDGCYTLSLRNQLQEPVTSVVGVIVFYDQTGNPIDVVKVPDNYPPDTIPPGLARRVMGTVDPSVKGLARRFEVRILDFRIVSP
jgi:S1-C subfamily serine protease